MMPRPYQTLEMAQLEVIFASNLGNSAVLAELEAELDCRTTRKAAELQAKVLDAIQVLANPQLSLLPATAPAASLTRAAPVASHLEPASLVFRSPVDEPPEQHARQVATPEEIPSQRPAVAKMLAPTSPASVISIPVRDANMPAHIAEKILGVRNDVPWALVEAARNKLVSLASPERLAQLPAQQRDRVVVDAKRANSAYLVLAQHRCLSF